MKIVVTEDALREAVRQVFAHHKVPAYVTSSVSGKTVTMECRLGSVTVTMFDDYMDPDDVRDELSHGVLILSKNLAAMFATVAWERRPWWVSVAGMTPGLFWLGTWWCRRQAKQLAKVMSADELQLPGEVQTWLK